MLKSAPGKHFLSVTHSDGEKGWALTCKNRLAVEESGFGREFYIDMNGQEIFKFAVRKVPELIREVLRKNEVKQEEIDWFGSGGETYRRTILEVSDEPAELWKYLFGKHSAAVR